MPPRVVDEKPLMDMAGILHGIADILRDFSRLASKAEEGGGHVDPLVRINGSLADIREVVKGLGAAGDHSAEYQRIETSLREMANAVRDIASGKYTTE